MNFLADESCAGPVIRALREAGHDVAAVAEVAKGSTDEQVLERALNENRDRPNEIVERGAGKRQSDGRRQGAVREGHPSYRPTKPIKKRRQLKRPTTLDTCFAPWEGKRLYTYSSLYRMLYWGRG